MFHIFVHLFGYSDSFSSYVLPGRFLVSPSPAIRSRKTWSRKTLPRKLWHHQGVASPGAPSESAEIAIILQEIPRIKVVFFAQLPKLLRLFNWNWDIKPIHWSLFVVIYFQIQSIWAHDCQITRDILPEFSWWIPRQKYRTEQPLKTRVTNPFWMIHGLKTWYQILYSFN